MVVDDRVVEVLSSTTCGSRARVCILARSCRGAKTFREIAEVAADLDDDLLDAVGVARATPSAATFARIAAMSGHDELDQALRSWGHARGTGSGRAGRQDDARRTWP